MDQLSKKSLIFSETDEQTPMLGRRDISEYYRALSNTTSPNANYRQFPTSTGKLGKSDLVKKKYSIIKSHWKTLERLMYRFLLNCKCNNLRLGKSYDFL